MPDKLPAYVPPAIMDRGQARPMIRMITKMLPKRVQGKLLGRAHKITTQDVKIKEKKIKYW